MRTSRPVSVIPADVGLWRLNRRPWEPEDADLGEQTPRRWPLVRRSGPSVSGERHAATCQYNGTSTLKLLIAETRRRNPM